MRLKKYAIDVQGGEHRENKDKLNVKMFTNVKKCEVESKSVAVVAVFKCISNLSRVYNKCIIQCIPI